MVTQQVLIFIKQNLFQGKSKEDIKKTLLSGGGWTESDIDEAFREVEMNTQSQTISPKKIKGFGLLLGIEIFLFALIIIGFILGNKIGKTSDLEDIIAFAALIAIIPSIILSFFGIKDGIKGIKNHTNGGVLILISSILLLAISVFSAANFLGVISTLVGIFRFM